MANTSFYGGKPGFSFIIVKSFSSVTEMVENFKKGPTYSAVHYDEHVLINTENKNDPNNGKVFRRGYDYTNEMGGAVYIGTIVGPAGRAPLLELTTIEQVKLKQETEGFENRYSEGNYSVPVSMVPGKDGTKFNDVVEWACCCVRSENGEDSIAYIGFKFPYLVNEFTAESVSPYYNRSNNTDDFVNQNLTERVDDKTHPFYEKWNFCIPKGIKGDTFKNFRVMKADATIQDYEGRQDDIDNSRDILVYDYYHYDKDGNGEPVSIFLGDYNMIDDISFDEEGTVVIDYSHDDAETYTKLLKWIKKVTLDSINGHFIVEYNHDTDKNGNPTIYETDLAWVKSIAIAEDGKITLHYTGGKADEILTNTHLRWINDIEMHADGTVKVNYNDGTNDIFDKELKYIDHIYFNKIDSDTSEGDNKFHVVYNNGDDEAIDNIIKFINNIYIDDDETKDSDYLFHVVYNTGEDVPLGNQPINYIHETAIDVVDYHFLVYYSNPNIRKKLTDDGLTRSYNGKDGWLDLGSIKDDAGVLIGFNLKPSDHPGIEVIDNALQYLDTNYQNGLINPLYKGKIVTIGETGDNKLFYAFDYDTNKWYYLGTFNNDNVWTMVAEMSDIALEAKKQKLAIGGVWFILEGEDD